MFNNVRLGTKLIAILLMVSLIPFVGISLFSYYQAQNGLKSEVYNKLLVYANDKEKAAELWFQNVMSNTIAISSNRDVYQSLNILNSVEGDVNDLQWQEQMNILDEVFAIIIQHYNVDMAIITDQKGRIVFSTDQSSTGADLSQRPYLKTALQGTHTTSDFFYSDVLEDYCMAFASPIYSEGNSGEIIGVFINTINQRDVNEMILEGLEDLGKTADAYLIDGNSILLTSPRHDHLKIMETKIQTDAARRLAAAISARQMNYHEEEEYVDYVGSRVLGDSRVIRMGDQAVGLIVCIDTDEAFGIVNAMRTTMLITCSIVAILISLIGWRFSRSISQPILNSVENLSEGAQQVASASNQISASSQQLAEGSAEQASAIEETSSTLEEASSMVKQNTENTKQAALLSKQAKEAADKGNHEMEEMMISMQEIKKSSDQIAKIIKVIDEIAFQTNILSLNAAVEAARAGEAGMGFAVVAEEVRNLAQRSAQAAKDTASIIENNIELAEKGVHVSDRVRDALLEISLQTKKVSELMDEVAAASQEQAQGIMQINTAIGQMEQVIQQNAANAEESASASEELNAQAQNMKNIVQELVQIVNGNSAFHNIQKTTSNTRKFNRENISHLPQINTGKKIVPKKEENTTKIIDPEEVIPLEEDPQDF